MILSGDFVDRRGLEAWHLFELGAVYKKGKKINNSYNGFAVTWIRKVYLDFC